jgi:hypothetical protein
MLLLGAEGLHKPRNSNTMPSVVVPIAPSNLWADACVPIGSAVVEPEILTIVRETPSPPHFPLVQRGAHAPLL